MAGTRYVRYIIFAFVCLLIIFFTTSSSVPSTGVTEQVYSAGDKLREKLHGEKPQPQRPAGMPGSNIEEIKEELNKIPQDTSTPENHIPEAPEDTQLRHGTQQGINPHTDLTKGKMNATFVTLARNSDIYEIAKSIRQVEDRFNHQFHYDWVFLNDQPFDDAFIKMTTKLVSGKTRYGLIDEEHWSFPEWIDQDKAAAVRKKMAEDQVIYGDSISYRHMCRFESGFFFRQPLMNEYEWYWRVEPSIKLFCDIEYDVFKYMADNKKKYSFTLSLREYKETIPTLWDSTKKFIKAHPEHIAKDNSMGFLSDDGGDTYNNCHFWSNFEVGNLNWLRSKAYIDFFTSLDKDGGFFYERWGDAPVHSIAAGLLLNKDEIHFFNDIGYWHVPFTHCPNAFMAQTNDKCHCDPNENFDWNGYSCTAKFFELHGLEHPAQT